MTEYKHVLFAADFAPESESIGMRAADLARRYQARFSMVHVVEQVLMDPANELMLTQDVGLEQQLVDNARTRLERLAERIGMPDAERSVQLGSTKLEIIRVAREQAVDLIVIGSHGRHGLALLLGSTANAVLHGAPCDVLAVRIRS